jgi:hypothetical protein
MFVHPLMAITPASPLTVVAESPKNLIPKDSAWIQEELAATKAQKMRNVLFCITTYKWKWQSCLPPKPIPAIGRMD